MEETNTRTVRKLQMSVTLGMQTPTSISFEEAVEELRSNYDDPACALKTATMDNPLIGKGYYYW